MPVLVRQSGANPSSERRRAPSEIHSNIEDAAVNCSDEFALGGIVGLKVDTAEDVMAGVRQVVLHECHTQPLREDLHLERLFEVAPMIRMSIGFDEQHVGNGEGGEAEGHGVCVSKGTE